MVEQRDDEAAPSNLNDVPHMRAAVFFEGAQRPQRLSRFWVLLVLSSIIAAAGVVAESTATVIGAMIVAPMMLPIQGTMLATVLGDQRNLARSMVLMIAGAAAAIGIGFLVGMMVPEQIVAATNSQVYGRVNPGLIDLLAALATGAVGSIALIRRDISDTLPGVAIAISLVPPLVVSGLTLESGAFAQSLGALLLFVTNVASILATGVVIMAIYKVHRSPYLALKRGGAVANERKAILVIASMLIIVSIPLTFSSVETGTKMVREATIRSAATEWASESGWDLASIETEIDGVRLRVIGTKPEPAVEKLTALLQKAGVDPRIIEVEFVPSTSVKLSTPAD